jgi:hypothetical protein
MRIIRRRLVIALPFAVVVMLSALLPLARAAVPAEDRVLEIARVRLHFDSVLAELQARDLSGLSHAQRTRRAEVVNRLAAYRDHGVFPHNYDFPGQAVPYFVDRKTGTLCAVAHLMALDGHRVLVDRVAATNNNVWVAELAGDSAFVAWLDDAGITIEEAARIQVPYADGGAFNMVGSSSSAPAYLAAYAVATTGALATSAVNATLNRKGTSRVLNTLGFALGATATGFSVAVARDGAPWQVAAASSLVGVTSMGLSARGFVRRQATMRQRAAQATVSPMVTQDGKPAAAMSVSIQF